MHFLSPKTLTICVVISGLVSFLNPLLSQCLMTPVSLEQRITNSSLVIEGRVVSKKSEWNSSRTLIETHHVIEVYKVFKGNIKRGTVTIITQGGVVGTDMLVVSHSLELAVGEVGVFTLTDNNSQQDFLPYAASQAFIRYNENKSTGHSIFDSYDDLNFVYEQINKVTARRPTELKSYVSKSAGKSSRGEATPNITGLSPSSISAGTYSLLTITGSDFGNTAGSVDFPDADDGGATFITADATLIQSWTDTQITIFVPTGATTGNVRVTNSTAETGTSADILTVTFNISGLNSTFQQTADYTPDLINNNGSGGYTFTFNNNYFLNSDAVDRYDEVIEQWRCESGINWNSNGAATTTTSCDGFDGINLVTFDSDCGLPAGVLGTAFSFYSACGTGGVAYWSVSELDIKFDLGTTWNFTLDPPTGGEFDFYSVMLHEMGHAHQLGHTPVSSDVMFFSISNGVEKRTLNANNISAVNFIMTRNNTNEQAYNGSTGGSIAANACGSGPMIFNGCNIAPTTAFSADATGTCNSSLTVNFTDQSTGSPTAWSWDFGDGNTSMDQNPTHNYIEAGGFDVALTTSNSNGSDALTINSFITVTDGVPVVTTCDPTSANEGNFGQTVSNVSFVGIDNTTSTLTNVAYTDFSCSDITAVDIEDTYSLSVTLNATNAGGFDQLCFVYIDYNNDGSFALSERVMNVTQPTGGSGTFTTPVTISAAAVTETALRMRVVSDVDALSGPCENNFAGDVEDYGIYINAAPLPITLANFDIVQTQNNAVDISWQTASEINNDYFTIERSKNGYDWKVINQVKGAGNTTTLLSYNAIDQRPFSGISYYRLKQTDFDGQFSYSDIKSISIYQERNSRLRVYPNPNNGEFFNIQFDNASYENVSVVVTDIYGRSVYSAKIPQANDKIWFDKKLSNGYYAVTVYFGNQKITKTLVIR